MEQVLDNPAQSRSRGQQGCDSGTALEPGGSFFAEPPQQIISYKKSFYYPRTWGNLTGQGRLS